MSEEELNELKIKLKKHIETDDIEAVKGLINSGFNVNIEFRSDNCFSKITYRAIHYAMFDNRLDIAKLLIEAGARVNNYYNYTFTPLHIAAEYADVKVAKLLIEAGAHVNSLTRTYQTALHIAAENGKVEMVKFLIESGADVNLQTSYGYTALHYSVVLKDIYDKKGKYLGGAIYPKNIQIVRDLVWAGADVTIENSNGYTALNIATNNLGIQDSYYFDEDTICPVEIDELLRK